jgi:hypothetical protein
MLTVLVSLAFLLTLGLAGIALVAMVVDDGAKIVAALAGRSFLASPPLLRPVTVRFSPAYPRQSRRPVHVQPELRAAA